MDFLRECSISVLTVLVLRHIVRIQESIQECLLYGCLSTTKGLATSRRLRRLVVIWWGEIYQSIVDFMLTTSFSAERALTVIILTQKPIDIIYFRRGVVSLTGLFTQRTVLEIPDCDSQIVARGLPVVAGEIIAYVCDHFSRRTSMNASSSQREEELELGVTSIGRVLCRKMRSSLESLSILSITSGKFDPERE